MPKPEIIGDRDLYQIQNQIGHGAFATVYKGKRLANNQTVAIKKIKSLSKTEVQMVTKEIQIMDGLRHKNIVEYIANFRYRGQWYIILEYCGKGDMEQYKKKVGKIPEYHCKLFVKCVMEALIFMHNKNIAHRDLKLSNILITDDYQLKLADFGFSKDLEEGYFTSFCGTPLSMAPQILRRQKYSPKCDVWSLGVLTYMMLFNRPPFFPTRSQGIGLPGIINAVLNRPHKFDDKVKISSSGRQFIDLCLQKDANKRVSILTLKQHTWFNEGVDLNRSSQDRQQAFQSSLKDQRAAGHTLCKLMLFGVFEQHLKKILQTMQISEEKVSATLKTLDDYYLQQSITQYYLLLMISKLQQLNSRELVIVIQNCSSYRIKLNKINRFNQYLAEITTLVHGKLQKLKQKTQKQINLNNKITAFVLNQVDLLFDTANQTIVAQKKVLLRNLCELVVKDYGISKISVQWGGNNEYEQYYTYIAQYLAKLNEQTITNVINQQLSNDSDLQAVWLIENDLQSFESIGHPCEIGKIISYLFGLPSNFGSETNFETQKIELLEHKKQIGLR